MIADLLPRLDQVKETKPGQWIASCPSHQDNSPSLAIKELSDGRVLLHCWSGCHTRDIVNAIGLDLRYLYPPKPVLIQDNQPVMPSWKRKQFQGLFRLECMVITLFKADVKANRFNIKDLDRYFLAFERLKKIEGILYG